MQTLTIKDLSVTEELDRKAMAAVRGGMKKAYFPYYSLDVDASKHHFSADVSQFIGQTQNFDTATGNNVAFLDHSTIRADVKGRQTANNNVNF